MGQVFTWCFAAPVVFIFTMLAIMLVLAVIARILGPVDVEATAADGLPDPAKRHLDCPSCRKRLSFSIPETAVRCSCGNIMPKPDGPSGTCPKCFELIHVARSRRSLRVKCPCGNVSAVKP